MLDDSENMAPVVNKTKGKGKGKTIEQMYQKKTQLEHILLRPDTYIGSIEKVTQPMWVFDKDTSKIVQREITYVPGLYKIFDEIVVNAADNKQRDPTMDRINVSVDQEANTISVWNNGNGIPVVMHSEQKMYVPELIFGHLLTGSNFDDDEKKTTGGRNGFGAKLANIFSTEFVVETADSSTGQKFKQVFNDNMTNKKDPKITAHSGKDFTCITFTPDLAKFKMDCLDDDTVALLCKRVYDIAGCCNSYQGSRLQVYLNGKKLPVKSFQSYMELYEGVEAGPETTVWEKVSDKWEIGVGPSDGQFTQVSFVNSICTTKGGQHANLVADKVVAKLAAVIKRKNKGEEVKGHLIKQHLSVYVNCLIENPTFDSQTKEQLTTRSSAFASEVTLSDKFFKAVEKSPVIDKVLSWAQYKQKEQLKKKGGNGKKTKLTGITKLDDANFAGTGKSKDCTLILTEGDSAKSLAVSGLSIVGRDYYGVFPLKGKPLNVREANHSQIMKNEEIQNICKILGLRHGVEYKDVADLRYGHLLIMADQDHDGSHIKGLLVNFIHHFWPSLLTVPGFMQQFITPIVRVTKGVKDSQSFFTIPEYHAWKTAHKNGKGWTTKYYKGLGTSSAKDAKEYFADLSTHRIDFEACSDPKVQCDSVDMAFSKKRVQDRKDWLLAFDESGPGIDYGVEVMTYSNFVNQELVLFSMADNQRSIPSVMDGFKPSQRKVLFACFKRKLVKEIKVAQLAGYVSEHSAYHHGEMSLNGTIVGMAQDFVGANNIQFLFPSGQFGTRLQGGKDAASPRYIFTRLEAITRAIFHPEDDQLLSYLEDDGQSIEPKFFSPVIPTVLVNGSDGIGTGWSTFVPNYNPADVIAALRSLLHGNDVIAELKPWYRGFTGEIEAKTGKDAGSYLVKGGYVEVDENTIEVTELPVRTWTQTYKQFLETMLTGAADSKDAGVVKDFRENHTDRRVSFTITFNDGVLQTMQAAPGGVAKRMKLDATLSTSNMMLFNAQGQIAKYGGAAEVIAEFYGPRLLLYGDRKEAMVDKLEAEWRKLSNQCRFIVAVCEGELVVANRPKKALMAELKAKGYLAISANASVQQSSLQKPAAAGAGAVSSDDSDSDSEDDDSESKTAAGAGGGGKGYDYLLSMKLWSLTQERVEEMRAQLADKEEELEELRGTTPEEMWLWDLDDVEASLGLMELEALENAKDEEATRKRAQKKGPNSKKAAANKKGPSKSKKGKKKGGWDSDESESEEEEVGMEDDFDDEDVVAKPSKQTKKKGGAAGGAAAAKAQKPTIKSRRAAAAAAGVPKPNAADPSLVLEKTAAMAARSRPAGAGSGKAQQSKQQAGSGEGGGADDEEEEVEILSLADRMRQTMGVTAASSSSSSSSAATVSILDDLSASSNNKPAAAAAKKKKAAAKKPKQMVLESDDDEEFGGSNSEADDIFGGAGDDDDDDEDAFVQTKAKPAAVRAPAATKKKPSAAAPKAAPVVKAKAAPKKKKAAMLDSDDESDEDSEAAADDFDDSDEEEFSCEAPAKQKKGATKKAPPAAAATVEPTAAPKKRATKSTNKSAGAATAAFSPGAKSPPKKKAAAAPKEKAAAAKPAPAPKAKAAAVAPAKKAAPAKKKKAFASSDEEEDSDEDDDNVMEVKPHTPKPQRQRKAIVYAVESDEEDEEGGSEDDEAVDDDDDEFEDE